MNTFWFASAVLFIIAVLFIVLPALSYSRREKNVSSQSDKDLRMGRKCFDL